MRSHPPAPTPARRRHAPRLIGGVLAAFGLGGGGNDRVVGVVSAQVVTEVPADPNVAHAYHATPIPAPSHPNPAPSHRVIEAPRSPGHHSPRTRQHGTRHDGPRQHGTRHDGPRHHGPRHHAGSATRVDTAGVPGASTPFNEWAGGIGSRLIPRPPLSSLLQRIPAASGTIPEARRTPVWKQPYSYGYFGASGKRHWTKHHSYRDNDTRWTLR